MKEGNPNVEHYHVLLKAEHAASIHNHDEAKQLYEASIKAAKDYGDIHELGLSLELYGDYYSSLGLTADARLCYKNAYMYYTQWGACTSTELFTSANLLT